MRSKQALTILAIAICSTAAHAQPPTCLSDDDCPVGQVCYRLAKRLRCASDGDAGAECGQSAEQALHGVCKAESSVGDSGDLAGGGQPSAAQDGGTRNTHAAVGDGAGGGCNVLLGRARGRVGTLGLLGLCALVLARRRRSADLTC